MAAPYTAERFVTFLEAMVGQPYWYGTCVQQCSKSLLTSKAKQYPSHYGAARTKRYESDIAADKVCQDCVGLVKGFFWTGGGEGVAEYIAGGPPFYYKHGAGGCPDKSANGLFTWVQGCGCKNGKLATMPDVPGILLHKDGHVGVYVGGGYAVEAMGFDYGVRKTKVQGRGWTDWAFLPSPLITYTQDEKNEDKNDAKSEVKDTVAKKQVIIGSARIDERGKATGGKAGDQTGNEVSTQAWYKHGKGWRVLRPIDPVAAQKIGDAMEAACANRCIGYDQNERLTLYNAAKPYGFDPAQVQKDVETDCSALVRVCVAYAGITVANFNTGTEASMLLGTGAFRELTGSEYTDKPDRLARGDVLVTKTKGHTVIVLTDGPLADRGDEDKDDNVAPDDPAADNNGYVRTEGSYWLRTKPSVITGTKIEAVPGGTLVRVYGEADGWYGIKVMATGSKGYISGKALTRK